MRNNKNNIPENEWDNRRKRVEGLLARCPEAEDLFACCPEAPIHVIPYRGGHPHGDTIKLFPKRSNKARLRDLLLAWADFSLSPQGLYKADTHNYTSYLIPKEDLQEEEWDTFWEELQAVLPEAKNWDKGEVDEIDIGIPSDALQKGGSSVTLQKEHDSTERLEWEKKERKEKRDILLTKIGIFTLVPLFWVAVFAFGVWLMPGTLFPEKPVSYSAFQKAAQVQEDTRTIGVDIFLRQTVYTGTKEHPEVSYYRYKLDTHCDYYQLETSYKSKELLPFVKGTVNDEKATSLATNVTEQTITYKGQVYEKDFYYEIPMLELTVPENVSLSDWRDQQMQDAYQAYKKALKNKNK